MQEKGRGERPLGADGPPYAESSVSISRKASSAFAGSIFPLAAAVLPASIATENRSLADCASGPSLAVAKMSGRNLVITASSRSSVTLLATRGSSDNGTQRLGHSFRFAQFVGSALASFIAFRMDTLDQLLANG